MISFGQMASSQLAKKLSFKSADDTSSRVVEMYGTQVAHEYGLIEEVLLLVAKQRKVELDEGVLDAFCREREEKLSRSGQPTGDAEFDRMRVLNMLFEGCLRFLTISADAIDSGDVLLAAKKGKRALHLIDHLCETLNHKNGKKGVTLSKDLERLYEFGHTHLSAALEAESVKKKNTAKKIRKVHEMIEKIYNTYLELEIRQDAEKFLG